MSLKVSIGRSRLGVYPALLSYSRVDGELWRRLDPRSGPTFATIHGHMIYGGWQDSRLVLSILTSISRGYEPSEVKAGSFWLANSCRVDSLSTLSRGYSRQALSG